MKIQKQIVGGGRVRRGGVGWGQGGSEQRIEVLVKIKKYPGSGRGGGGSEWMYTKKCSLGEG